MGKLRCHGADYGNRHTDAAARVMTDVLERESTAGNSAVGRRESELPPFAAIRKQLMRRDRKTGRLMTPATFDFRFGHDRQQIAISMLFAMAHTIADRSGLIMTKRELELTRARLRAQADGLRETSATTARLALGEPFADEHHVDPVVEAIREIEARLVRLESKTICVERDCGDLVAQGVAIHIAQACHSIFGKVMPGVVAALASAVLNTRIEHYAVRNWWRAFTAQ